MIKKQATATIPSEWGDFEMTAFAENENELMPHISMVHKNTNLNDTVNVRFHSECLTGDVFHSKRCDCGKQLEESMKYFNKNGGVLLYLRQEGRGIGIINKLKAYNLQDKGYNTAEANIELGLPADGRDFSVAVEMLEQLGIKKINLLTNNPKKLNAVEQSNIELLNRIPLEIEALKENKDYLETKKDYFGHLLKLN